MTKEKDPAFLFYSKDWLEGTMDMMPDEKGVYIDLLCHQHQRKGLPIDIKRLSKLCGLPETEFLQIWQKLKEKFNQIDDRLFNQKLTKVVTERETKSHTNKITGTFAAIIRTSNADYSIKEKIKKIFKIDSFLTVNEENLTERITEWYEERLKSIEDENEDENEIIRDKKRGAGKGKEKNSTFKNNYHARTRKSGFSNNGTYVKDSEECEERF